MNLSNLKKVGFNRSVRLNTMILTSILQIIFVLFARDSKKLDIIIMMCQMVFYHSSNKGIQSKIRINPLVINVVGTSESPWPDITPYPPTYKNV